MHLLLDFFITISSLVGILCLTNDENWNYHELGPDIWSDIYSTCAGYFQSPINIRTTCTTYQSFTPFHFSLAYEQIHNFTLANNGHTIVGTYNGQDPSPLTFTGGGLDGTFVLDNFHLHWGENYKSGSEHQVNNVKYAGEIHFVHTNPETSESIVLGIFMQSYQSRNGTKSAQNISNNIANTKDITTDEWKNYFSKSQNLRNKNNSTTISLNISLLMGKNLNDFWRYKGSLTTPPCTEGIIWNIFTIPILFNDNDINIFRENILYEGYRDPQPLYDRIIYRNFHNEILPLISDHYCCSKRPDVWSDTYPICASQSQSPINIRTACTTYQPFIPFHFSFNYNLSQDFILINNGHSIIGTYNGSNSSALTLTGGGLNGMFEFFNFHLHWGENYKSGSEHHVNGVKYAGEIHFVHINPETNQIAVLGIFMDSKSINNSNETMTTFDNLTSNEWKRYFSIAQTLQEYTNSTILSLNLAPLMGENLNDFLAL